MYLLVPRGTDIQDNLNAAGQPDQVEVGAGTGRVYAVVNVDDSGGGFPNEHRVVVIQKVNPWPAPIPTPTLLPPITSPQQVAAAVSADNAQTLTLSFNSPAGQMACFIGAYGLIATVLFASNTGIGILAPVNTSTTTGITGKHLYLNLYNWAHTGGPGSFTVYASKAATIAGAIYAMAGSALDQTGDAVNNLSPQQVSTGGPTVGASDNAVAAFCFDDGGPPITWPPGVTAGPASPLSGTSSGTGPFYLSFASAFGIPPGVVTAAEMVTAPSGGFWCGAILCTKP